MKVAFLNGVFARIGGIEEFTHDLVLELLRKDMAVRIVCASLKNPTLDRLKRAGAKVRKIPVYHGCRWNIPDYALLPFACFWLRGADVVIHQKPFAKWAYRILPQRAKHIYLTSYSPADQFPDIAGAKRVFSFFDGVVTQLESFKVELLERGVECPISVIPLIPPRIAELPVSQNESRILRIGMMGRLEPQKNPAYACDVMEALSQSLPEGKVSVEFHVYGEGSLSSSLKKKTGSLKCKTEFHGVYERSAVERIVSENDGFLITSNSEGQCIVALEILAAGRPVFATPVGALPAILTDPIRGALLPRENPGEAAKMIRTWFELNRLTSASDVQKSYQKNYDRDAVVAAYVDLLLGIGRSG
ncbi:glycosyltransferase family 4 protein [Pontiella sp.]|uniref:glycosyltransferase family 4 protein n=1 Tax=Pontiella sp. TaxID=2837462 RepID=UPI0035654192